MTQDEQDYQYWRGVADILGCGVIGYTERKSALFVEMPSDVRTITVPGWLAERILGATRAAEDRGFKLGMEENE